jgi:hypothetical protein
MSVLERLYFWLKAPNQNLHDRVRDDYLRKVEKPEVYKRPLKRKIP